VVELYLPVTTDSRHHIASRAERAVAELRAEGTEVHYLRWIYFPEDETCFHLFDGPSVEAIAEATRRATIEYDRIVEAIESGPTNTVQ
jgi:Nickel responsive protein SCO4226-like